MLKDHCDNDDDGNLPESHDDGDDGDDDDYGDK